MQRAYIIPKHLELSKGTNSIGVYEETKVMDPAIGKYPLEIVANGGKAEVYELHINDCKTVLVPNDNLRA